MNNQTDFDPYLENWLPKTTPNSIPTAIYIHLPWCVKKCPYCDFNSHAIKGEKFPEQAYVESILEDLANWTHTFDNRTVISLFFGGGTPSLFSPKSMTQIINYIENHFITDDNIEITLEANPGTTDQSHFLGYIDAGINRISIGIQSFNEQQLKQLGRIHSSQQALRAIDDAKNVGFKNINIDLMFGLPNQSLKEAMTDLDMAIKANTNHLSWYELTIEPNTAFAHKPPTLPNHDLQADITEQGQKKLTDHKFNHIEISAFAKANHVCRHNVHVWNFGDYLGVGAGAHSKLSDNNEIWRHYQHYHPNQYMNQHKKTASSYRIKQQDIVFEYLLNRLRINQPISHKYFALLTGCKQNKQVILFKEAIEKKLILQLSNGDWQATTKGKSMHNELLLLCMPQ